jgi:hypothetical protein
MGEMRLGVHLECLFLVISDSIAQLLGQPPLKQQGPFTLARRSARITEG